MGADGKARVSRDPAILAESAATAFGQISQCQGPDRPLAAASRTWKNPTGPPCAESGGCDLRASAAQPGCFAAFAGLFKTRNRDGRDGWPSMGTPGANDPGRPESRLATQAEVVGLAVGITGMAELECERSSIGEQGRARGCGHQAPIGVGPFCSVSSWGSSGQNGCAASGSWQLHTPRRAC